MDYQAKLKLVRKIQDRVDGYLDIEKQIQKLIEKAYQQESGHRDCYDVVIEEKEQALQLQYNSLGKYLNAANWKYTPACYVNEYTENKLKALKVIEGLLNE
jgi:hypothetical protein